MFDEHTIYVVGDAKAPSNNPITLKYSSLFIGFVVDTRKDEIVDVESSTTIDLTAKFIRSLLIGETFTDPDTIIQKIESRYFGSSQKGLIVAYRDAVKKYNQIKNS
ncbi:DUF3870 domain-containing protein [Virgibacillus alimentarius]|uniref:DUF3870 domain-containing protein n=1 Tax=Virgibacillus alimentarius TaxID=698769 RepID=A0ABS4S9D7_9BACI|nr:MULTISPECIES: DUF3870 domain-containing protein [Virgibacillus]MBP2258115.1 hypothetical protein [Virgibacillus alimentarius]HLR69140.1 DUF3870 domain-containing protein [Virgibacillus sp.]